MKRILIVNETLMVGGGERLLYELVVFARSQGYKADVLIINNNLQAEYYDDILKKMGIDVHRIPSNRKKIIKKIYFLKWYFTLKYLLRKKYVSTIIINLDFANKVLKMIKQKNSTHIWHISNIVQYEYNNTMYPYNEGILKNKDLNLWLINEYQKEELEKQYGKIECKIHNFKLFLNKNEH